MIEASWNSGKAVLNDFQSMLEDIFTKEGIDLRLVDVITSSIILICEVSIEDVRDVRRVSLAERRQLYLRGIVQINLEYYTRYGSILVSFI